MTPENATIWQSTNQSGLLAQVERIRSLLINRSSTVDHHQPSHRETLGGALEIPMSPALTKLCEVFALSTFERDLLLLCAGMEIDKEFPSLCAKLNGDPQRPYPTFNLALSALDAPQWQAFAPDAALRYWKLIHLGNGYASAYSSLRIDESILYFLLGVKNQDQRLLPFLDTLPELEPLIPSQQAIAHQMEAVWEKTEHVGEPPFFLLCGDETLGKISIASGIADSAHRPIMMIAAERLPKDSEELDELKRLWGREALLKETILGLNCDSVETEDTLTQRNCHYLVENLPGALIVCYRTRSRSFQRPHLSFDINKPTLGEQRTLWKKNIPIVSESMDTLVDRLVYQFYLRASTIQTIGRSLQPSASETPLKETELAHELWQQCRIQARPQLSHLVQLILPKATWQDLVLPENQTQTLSEIVAFMQQRVKVYEAQGFVEKSDRGLGFSVLFAGGSGTGKTMAAEVLARELDLDLYRIDLSNVINKYIGETEKNIRQVFDAAEEAGAVLLFDEADALFGKRSEVKDSHDRHANIEVSYLLQRMEAYQGLAVMTTNLKDSLDTAFLRRFRFIVNFPFPRVQERVRIWETVFPEKTPTDSLDLEKLAKLNLSGGHIRNIALHAAFLAAKESNPVSMQHMLQATQSEYAKLEKTLSLEETRGWL